MKNTTSSIIQKILLVCGLCLSGYGGLLPGAAAQSTASTSPPAGTENALDTTLREGAEAERAGDHARALGLLQKGLERAEAARDELRAARFQMNLAFIASENKQWDRALDLIGRARTRAETAGSDDDTASALRVEGGIYRDRGDLAQAVEIDERVLALRQKIGEPVKLTEALNALAIVCQQRGDYGRARDLLLRTLKLDSQTGRGRDAAQHVGNLGVIFNDLGQLDTALDCALSALTLRERYGPPESVATDKNNLGAVYQALGQNERALDAFRQAFALLETQSDKINLASSLNNIAAAEEALGQEENAVRDYERTLALEEAAGDREAIADTLNNLGHLALSQGNTAKALAYAERAAALRQALGNLPRIAESENNLGVIYLRRGDRTAARAHGQRAFEAVKDSGRDPEIVTYAASLGGAYQALGDLPQAETLFRTAITHYEALADRVADPSTLGDLADVQSNDVYGQLARLLVRKNNAAEALAVLERGRVQGLIRQTGRSHANLLTFLGREDRERYEAGRNALARTLHEFEAARSAESEGNNTARQTTAARTRWEAARTDLNRQEESLRARYGQFRRLRGDGGKAVTPESLAALAVAHPDTLYIEWTGADDSEAATIGGYVFAVSASGGIQAFPMTGISWDALGNRLRTWQRLVSSAPGKKRGIVGSGIGADNASPEAERNEAQTVGDAVLGPLEKAGLLSASRFTHLVFVPDGALADLPLAALRDQDGKRLIERYTVSTSLSLGILDWPPSETGSGDNTLLCIADPVGKGGERLTRVSRGGDYGALPNARAEGKAVSALFSMSLTLIGAEARKAEVKKRMPDFTLLHFATHGLLDASHGLRSSLVLAPESNSLLMEDDGYLTAAEIAGMPLSARLAVLSACETARGQQSGGEGLLGLVWAFRAAGCPAIVASHWPVEDASTADLMTRFYTELRKGARKDDALTAAMRAFLNDPSHPERRYPYYWAAFDLFGDSSALFPSVKDARGA